MKSVNISTKTGYLEKRNRHGHWKKNYCEANDDKFICYKTNEKLRILSMININDIIRLNSVSDPDKLESNNDDNYYYFCIELIDKLYYFRTEIADNRIEWINTIQSIQAHNFLNNNDDDDMENNNNQIQDNDTSFRYIFTVNSNQSITNPPPRSSSSTTTEQSHQIWRRFCCSFN